MFSASCWEWNRERGPGIQARGIDHTRLGLKSADLEAVASSTLQGVQETSEVIDAPADDPRPVIPEGTAVEAPCAGRS